MPREHRGLAGGLVCLDVARELRYPDAEAVALANLSDAALGAGDHDRAVRLARQAAQITDGVPGWRARWVSYVLTSVLIEAGDLAAAEPVCTETRARARDSAPGNRSWSSWSPRAAPTRRSRRSCISASAPSA